MSWYCRGCRRGHLYGPPEDTVKFKSCFYCGSGGVPDIAKNEKKDKPMTEQAKPLTFEIGKYYRSKDRKFICVYVSRDNKVAWCVSTEGEYCTFLKVADGIVEWIDKPEVDWSKMAAWHKWVAMSDKGVWFAFTVKPMMSDGSWLAINCGIGNFISSGYYPKFSGDWRDSLVERPV